MNFERALCWIRRDLRLSDHRALFEACQMAKGVALVFVFDTTILEKLKDRDDRRVNFIYQSIKELDQNLKDLGSGLITLYGDPRIEIPRLARQMEMDVVVCNRDYEPISKERDETVEATLRTMDIPFKTFKDQVIFEGRELNNQKRQAYRVFTPYKNAWMKKIDKEFFLEYTPDYKKLIPIKEIKPFLKPLSLKKIGFKPSSLWFSAGEVSAELQLSRFLNQIDHYKKNRDIPSKEVTSELSVYLRFGLLSIRQLIRQIIELKTEGAQAWLTELIWREFYQMVLDRFPHVAHSTFKPEYNSIEWSGTEQMFKAWCRGQTGYPLVDAAMRNFNATGRMHNRLRMITASFLVKDLLVDWRKGEAYFARYLLDFDLAANNGGWQWCASTGCDAQPWFRIFNPVNQSKRFDPQGKFIRKVIPELAGFSDQDIHFPASTNQETQKKADCLIGRDYPHPTVDHNLQRSLVLELFKK